MKKNTNKTNKEPNGEVTPPYLSVARLEKVISLASNRNFSNVSYSLFEKYGFNRVDAILAFNVFGFLGLIDKDGNATELMAKLHLQGDLRKKEFEKIIRAAYKKLFDATNNNPHNLGKEDLLNEFAIHYGVSPRIARSAIPVFLKLCEYAGLKEETQVREIGSGGKAEKVKGEKVSIRTTKKADNIGDDAGFFPVRVAEGRMFLNIPSELHNKILESDDAKFHDEWRNLRTELKEFADKYIPENPKKDETSAKKMEGV